MIKLAGKIIDIETLYDDTHELCRDYEVEGAQAPDFRIRITPKDIDREREHSAETRKLEGRKPVEFSDGYIETLAVYRKIAEQLINDDIVLFHGSALAVDGEGIILTAKSGTGKSTLARHLRELMQDKLVMINDDKPLIGCNDGVRVHGTPWNGKHRIGNNVDYPLRKICVLERSDEPWIKKVEPITVLPELLQQTYRPADSELLAKTLTVLDKVCQAVECYRVGIVIDNRTAKLMAKTWDWEEKCAVRSIETQLKENGWIIYSNVGNSMMPLICQDKDLMVIEKRKTDVNGNPEPMHPFDAVLFKRDNGQLVLHRILEVRSQEGKPVYDICGDNQLWVERGVRDDQILGVLTKVIKDVNTANSYEMMADDAEHLEYVKKRVRRLPLMRAKTIPGRALRKVKRLLSK